MNCKPGDLALTLRDGLTVPSGAIVRCISVWPIGYCLRSEREFANVWHVEWRGRTSAHDAILGVPDAYLMPIRPDDEPAQTIRPQEVAA